MQSMGKAVLALLDIEQLCFKSGIECYVASPDPKVREAKHGYVIGNSLPIGQRIWHSPFLVVAHFMIVCLKM